MMKRYSRQSYSSSTRAIPRRRRSSGRGDSMLSSLAVTPVPYIPATYRGQEVKFVQVQNVAQLSGITSSGFILSLGGLVIEGSDIFNRIGRSIHVLGLSFFGQLCGGQSNIALDDNRNVVRLSVITAVSGATVGSLAYSLNTPLCNRTTVGLAHVYHDELISLESPGRDSTGYMPALADVQFRVNLGFKLNYTSGAAVPSFKDLFLVAISDSSAAPSPGFTNGAFYLTFVE